MSENWVSLGIPDATIQVYTQLMKTLVEEKTHNTYWSFVAVECHTKTLPNSGTKYAVKVQYGPDAYLSLLFVQSLLSENPVNFKLLSVQDGYKKGDPFNPAEFET